MLGMVSSRRGVVWSMLLALCVAAAPARSIQESLIRGSITR